MESLGFAGGVGLSTFLPTCRLAVSKPHFSCLEYRVSFSPDKIQWYQRRQEYDEGKEFFKRECSIGAKGSIVMGSGDWKQWQTNISWLDRGKDKCLAPEGIWGHRSCCKSFHCYGFYITKNKSFRTSVYITLKMSLPHRVAMQTGLQATSCIVLFFFLYLYPLTGMSCLCKSSGLGVPHQLFLKSFYQENQDVAVINLLFIVFRSHVNHTGIQETLWRL